MKNVNVYPENEVVEVIDEMVWKNGCYNYKTVRGLHENELIPVWKCVDIQKDWN